MVQQKKVSGIHCEECGKKLDFIEMGQGIGKCNQCIIRDNKRQSFKEPKKKK